MAFETEDSKSTIIFYRMGQGKVRYSGLVRLTDKNGVTTLRLTNQNITSCVFDDMEFQNPPSSGLSSDVSMTHYDADWSDSTPR